MNKGVPFFPPDQQAAFRSVLEQVAREENVSVEEVADSIRGNMVIGLLNPDPKIRNFWRRLPDNPTAEDIVNILALLAYGMEEGYFTLDQIL